LSVCTAIYPIVTRTFVPKGCQNIRDVKASVHEGNTVPSTAVIFTRNITHIHSAALFGTQNDHRLSL